MALGNALIAAGEYGAAIESYAEVLRVAPDDPDTLNNMGSALLLQGRAAEAMDRYARVAAVRPDWHGAWSNTLLARNYISDDPAAIAEAHRNWGERLAGLDPGRIRISDPDPGRVLRVAYISPDFRAHSVAWFIAPLFVHHDRRAVQVIAYSDVAHPDVTTQYLSERADEWHDAHALDDEQLVDRIRSDAVDVLVDLAGHTSGNRLSVFARRPAPVQVTYLGYPNTTGLRAIDARITDAIVDPPGLADETCTEKLFRLPGGFLCYAGTEAPLPPEPPCVKNGFVTFGSFNNVAKITRELVTLWSRILHGVPRSRLRLKGMAFNDLRTRSRFEGFFRDEGVDGARVELLPAVGTLGEHLAQYATVDIALDTFPYGGTTTTFEALWMGVPVVTLAGRTHASRVGMSILARAGFPQLAATSAGAYVTIASALARQPRILAAMRRNLRNRLRASTLCNGMRMAREIEAVYRYLWREKCAAANGSNA
jgi:predicted O-linked N-acetylglucosamine transferase (SPINDLY family)